MLKTSLTFSAVLLCSAVQARDPLWVKAGESNKSVVSVDVANVRTLGARTFQAWALYDFPSQQLDPLVNRFYSSNRQLYRIECGTDRFATLAWAEYSEIQGNGELVNSDDMGDKSPVYTHLIPGTMVDAVIDFVCSLKTPTQK